MALGGDKTVGDTVVTHWARRAAFWLPLGLGLLLVIAMVGVLIDPVHDKRQFTAFLFVRQDLVVAIGIALLVRFGLVPGHAASSGWTAALAKRPMLVVVGLLLLCWAGRYCLLANYDLTRDEQMAHAALYGHSRVQQRAVEENRGASGRDETADGGLILRKTKTKAGGGSHKKAGKSGPKIVF